MFLPDVLRAVPHPPTKERRKHALGAAGLPSVHGHQPQQLPARQDKGKILMINWIWLNFISQMVVEGLMG